MISFEKKKKKFENPILVKFIFAPLSINNLNIIKIEFEAAKCKGESPN